MHRRKLGVPWCVRFMKKTELAWEMIFHAKNKKMVTFGWIGIDSLYDRDSWLRNKINKHDMIYIADIPCNFGVWLKCPKAGVPPQKKGVRCCKPTREKVIEGTEPIQMGDLKDQMEGEEWHHVFIRDTERREL